MNNFQKFFTKYPDMDIDLLNGLLSDYVKSDTVNGTFIPIAEDPYVDEYELEERLEEEYDQDYGGAPCECDDEPIDYDGYWEEEDYDSFDYNADVQYVVASTSYGQNETFYFMGDKNGSHGFSELGCSMAERWGHENWDDQTVIDDQIKGYSTIHHAKLIGTQTILPDHFHSWVVLKRIYEVTKKQ